MGEKSVSMVEAEPVPIVPLLVGDQQVIAVVEDGHGNVDADFKRARTGGRQINADFDVDVQRIQRRVQIVPAELLVIVMEFKIVLFNLRGFSDSVCRVFSNRFS